MKHNRCIIIVVILFALALNTTAMAIESAEDTPAKSIVGAIRWDAWMGSDAITGTETGAAVEKALQNEEYHNRLPFYATIDGGKVTINANRDEVMSREIAYASEAGIDYWTLLWDEVAGYGRELYLRNPNRDKIKWCQMLGTWSFMDGDISGAVQSENKKWLVHQFQTDNYVKVSGDRPVLYLFYAAGQDDPDGASNSHLFKAMVDEIRSLCDAENVPQPYVVAMGSDGEADEAHAALQIIGADALCQYNGSNMEVLHMDYDDFALEEEQQWDDFRDTGEQVVPWVTAGWDKRPRFYNPMEWEKAGDQYIAFENYWIQQPTAQQVAAQIKNALDWNEENAQSAEEKLILIYAWNEFDEGGWICPTLYEIEGIDTPMRLDEIKKVLLGEMAK